MSNKKARGPRAKTRSLLKSKGRTTVNKLMKRFEVGQRVAVKINSAVHSGLPNKRFQGKSGQIAGKRGNSYVVRINQENALKTVIVSPAHLHALGGGSK